jgi:hypothetical protein
MILKHKSWFDRVPGQMNTSSPGEVIRGWFFLY